MMASDPRNQRQRFSALASFASFGAAVTMIALFASCAPRGALSPMAVSPEAKARFFKKPTTELAPALPATSEAAKAISADDDGYLGYKILDAKFSADMETRAMSATVRVQTPTGIESVDLLGGVRADGSASLIDTDPISPSSHRLAADAYCVDKLCRLIIFKARIKVGSKEVKRQFISEGLKKTPKPDVPAGAKIGQSQPVPAQPQAQTPAQKDDIFDHGSHNADDPNDELVVGENQEGEYVGAEEEPLLNERLWNRPEKPDAPPAQPAAPKTDESKKSPKAPPAAVPPKQQPQTSRPEPSTPLVPVKPVPAPKEDPKAKKSPEPAPQAAAPAKQEPELPAPPAEPDPQRVSREKRIGPLLNLRGGGRSVGSFNDGSIQNATQIPREGPAFKWVYTDRNTHWGTGLLVDLIRGVAGYMQDKFPGTVIMVGDLSKQFGGPLGTHASHESGLDVDIPYVGNDSFESVLTGKGRMSTDFDFKRNWAFLRAVAIQKITQDGEEVTVLNRVFMNPAVKRGFCQWAEATGILSNRLDADIMRRIRPTAGHDKHFHVRLKCSPHHPACRNQIEPPSGTGC